MQLGLKTMMGNCDLVLTGKAELQKFLRLC